MKLKLIAAAVASLMAGSGNAAVISSTAATGSELIFAISSKSNSAFSYTQDLGVTISGFNPAQSQAFTLASSFNEFLKPSNYDDALSGDVDRIQGVAPDATGGFAQPEIAWGVVGAQFNSGSSRFLATWSFNNTDEDFDPATPPTYTDGGFGDPIDNVAQLMDAMITANPSDPGGAKRNINELPGHDAPGNGSNLTTNPTITGDPTYQGGALSNYQAAAMFSGQDYFGLFGPAAGMEEAVAMYLWNAGFDANSQIVGVGQGAGPELGVWRLDFSGVDLSDPENPLGNVVLRYQVAAVPVPAAVWLLGSALLGLVGVSRRRVA